MKQIPIDAIRADVKAQPREHISTDIVAAYADDMTLGAEFPPLVVFQEGDIYWLADGFHRLSAARGVVRKVECDVRRGTLRDAILFSCGANAEHGYRRSNEDRRRSVAKLLQDAEWSQWSDHAIAKQARVSHTFVGRLRTDLTSNVASEPRTFTTKHGTTSKMQTGAIGKGKTSTDTTSKEISSDNAQRVEHGDKTPPPAAEKPDEPTGWLCPILMDIDAQAATFPAPAFAVGGLTKQQRHLLDAQRLAEIGEWFCQFAAILRGVDEH